MPYIGQDPPRGKPQAAQPPSPWLFSPVYLVWWVWLGILGRSSSVPKALQGGVSHSKGLKLGDPSVCRHSPSQVSERHSINVFDIHVLYSQKIRNHTHISSIITIWNSLLHTPYDSTFKTLPFVHRLCIWVSFGYHNKQLFFLYTH
jgi:hypothetical protein